MTTVTLAHAPRVNNSWHMRARVTINSQEINTDFWYQSSHQVKLLVKIKRSWESSSRNQVIKAHNRPSQNFFEVIGGSQYSRYNSDHPLY